MRIRRLGKRPGSHSVGPLVPPAAFYLLASITVSFLAGSSAPTPLYPLYQAEWGFSPITVTVVFGIYALALPDSGAEGIECAD